MIFTIFYACRVVGYNILNIFSSKYMYKTYDLCSSIKNIHS